MDYSLWPTCLELLARHLPPQHLALWLHPLHARVENECLLLLAPNRFVLEWVKTHYLPLIEQTLAEIQPRRRVHVRLAIGGDNDGSVVAPTHRGPTASRWEEVEGGALNPAFTFASFVSGQSNQLAREACLRFVEQPHQSYNPLLIYGATGLGKTHLLQAVGHALQKQHPQRPVVYQRAEHFVNTMVTALKHRTITEFKRYYRSAGALLMDDVQFFAGKQRSQEEFLHTFSTLIEARQPVIIACDRAPTEVGLESRLTAQFGGGLTVAIRPPELETRVAILRAKAQQMELPLSDEVARLMAQRVRANIRDLEGALHRVVARAQMTHQTITADLACEALGDTPLGDAPQPPAAQKLTVSDIQAVVAEHYRVTVTDLCSASRQRTLSQPRQMAMALAKELTAISLSSIGEAFGGRDHTTVLYACRKIKALQQQDATVRRDFNQLLEKLSS